MFLITYANRLSEAAVADVGVPVRARSAEATAVCAGVVDLLTRPKVEGRCES